MICKLSLHKLHTLSWDDFAIKYCYDANLVFLFRLQDEFVKVQNDLAKVQDNKVESSEQMQELVRKLQAQLASKTREVICLLLIF